MGEDADIAMRAGEVGEDVGHADGREARAEAAALLARAVLQVDEAAAFELFPEAAEGGVHAVEHHAGGGAERVVVADRLRVAARVDQRLVPVTQLVPALRDAAAFQQLRDQRHDMGRDLVAVARHLLRPVIGAAHAAIAERGIALVAELLRHAVAELHQAVVEAVELLAMLGEEAPAQALGLVSRRAVGVLGIGGEAGEVHLRAADRQLRARQQRRVAGAELRFRLEVGGDHRLEGGDVEFPERDGVGPGGLVQRGAVRQRQQPLLDRRRMAGRHGIERVGVFPLGPGRRVACVLREAEMDERGPAFERTALAVPERERSPEVAGIEARLDRGAIGGQVLLRRAGKGERAELHPSLLGAAGGTGRPRRAQSRRPQRGLDKAAADAKRRPPRRTGA